MNYSIWNDFSFYIYVVLLIASAVVIVSSIRRLLAEDEEKDVNIDFTEIEDVKNDINENEPNKNQEINENISLKSEEIVFKKEETIFDTPKKEEELHSSDEKAVLFLKSLNENLDEIKKSLKKISDFENRLNNIENLINSFEKEVKLMIEEQLKKNLSKLDINCQRFENYSEKSTPKYVMKYLEDIVDDFNSLEKEVILKRLKVIIEDLKKLSGE